MKKRNVLSFVAICLIILTLLSLVSCADDTKKKSSSTYSSSYNSDKKTDSSTKSDSSSSTNSSSSVNDWMKDQAEGKDYSSDDGGTYYCMGKNDTCPNKTKNAYDLYCDSCDPDGDNKEG